MKGNVRGEAWGKMRGKMTEKMRDKIKGDGGRGGGQVLYIVRSNARLKSIICGNQ
jgi:hypothetical protein